jgi:hypothetical protein
LGCFSAVNLGFSCFHIRPGLGQFRDCNVQLSIRLVYDRLERSRINLEKKVTGAYQGSFLIVLGQEIEQF